MGCLNSYNHAVIGAVGTGGMLGILEFVAGKENLKILFKCA